MALKLKAGIAVLQQRMTHLPASVSAGFHQTACSGERTTSSAYIALDQALTNATNAPKLTDLYGEIL
jgi:hypothetical protein